MSDAPSHTPMSDDEIARRLAELEASIDAETPKAAQPAASASTASVPRVLLGDEEDDGSLDYLKGDAAPAPAPQPRPTPRAEAIPVSPREAGADAPSGSARGGTGAAVQPMTNPILERAIGVARFAPRYYDAIAADPKATAEAALVVAIVAIASGIGGLRHGLDGFLVGIVMALVKWGLFAVAAYAILPRFAPGVRREGAGIAPLARTLGYAQGPRVLAIAWIIPLIGWSLSVVGTIWVILTSIVAIRQTAKVGFREAAIVTVVSWAIATIAAVILALIFGLGASAAL